MFSVTSPDRQLFAISNRKAPEKNNLQKQETYEIKNSECDWTHPFEKTISIWCYGECLSGFNRIKLVILLFYMSCINVTHYFKVL